MLVQGGAQIFGGFTSFPVKRRNQEDQLIADESAFLFSLTNYKKFPIKKNFRPKVGFQS